MCSYTCEDCNNYDNANNDFAHKDNCKLVDLYWAIRVCSTHHLTVRRSVLVVPDLIL